MADESRVSLRPAIDQSFDDVVVKNVEMFRAEMLKAGRLWLCCYLQGTGVSGDRITFEVSIRDGELDLEIGEMPIGSVPFESPHQID